MAFDFYPPLLYGHGPMNVVRYSDAGYRQQLIKLLAPSSLFDAKIEAQTRAIIEAVHDRGDHAVTELTERFNGIRLEPKQFAISKAELDAAARSVDASLIRSIATARKNIENFSKRSLRKGWMARNSQGGKVGEKYDPFQRVGIYIPGGTAPLVSTALMTITLAKVAGCPEIVVCTPCNKEGQVNPALLYAAQTAGATEIYRIGGGQAIAAMAYGTPTIRHTCKIFGPGNQYVVTAKRLMVGHVAIDLLPGPSEVLILTDNTARASFVAADLLAQAEHGSGHERIWLLTTSGKLIGAVQKEVERQLATLSRRDFVQKTLQNNGWLIQVEDIKEGIDLANKLAPEHCEIMTRNPARIARDIHTAGALCLGHYTPNVLGDYVAGPSHVLPTGGAGTSFPGLTVDQFQRRTSIIEYDRAAVRKSLPFVKDFARIEGLDAHGLSAAIRAEEL